MLRFHCYPKVPLLCYYKQRVRGRGTNLFAEKKKKALARLAEKKLHGEEKKKQVPGEKKKQVPGEKKKLFETVSSGNYIRTFYNFILKGKMVISINCWVHQQYCWVHLATHSYFYVSQ